MMKYFYLYKQFLFYLLIVFSVFNALEGNHIKGLDDSILFRINWPGQDDTLLQSPDYETLEMTTVNNERFQCLIPINYGESSGNDEKYTGPNALELLMPLFKKKICTLRLEAFWTYELCHGQWIKQYHEGREEKGQRYQDYNLGITSLEQIQEASKELDASLLSNPRPDIPQTKLEGVNMPYFSVNYSDGTICDLTGNPRVTRVLYVCYEEGRHSLYSIKETFTCEYEIIVLSSLLCQHPSYRPQEIPQTNLHCVALQAGTKRPPSLLRLEAESLKLRTHGTVLGGDISGGSVRIEVLSENEAEIVGDFSSQESSHQGWYSTFPAKPAVDHKMVAEFLSGDYCLHGGAGWWKYEFCHRKIVQQYHEGRDGSRYSIKLGEFDLEAHKNWLAEHPAKMYQEGKTQVSHFYTGGDYCDEIGKPRQVEVRLKCKEAVSQSSVSLYLLEPKTCEYVLGVETPLICPLLPHADEFGLFSLEASKEEKIEDETQGDDGVKETEEPKGLKEIEEPKVLKETQEPKVLKEIEPKDEIEKMREEGEKRGEADPSPQVPSPPVPLIPPDGEELINNE